MLNNAIKGSRYLFIFDNFEYLFDEQVPVGDLKDEDLTRFYSSLFDHNWRSTFVFTCRYGWQLLAEKAGKGIILKPGRGARPLRVSIRPLPPENVVRGFTYLVKITFLINIPVSLDWNVYCIRNI